MQSAPQGAAADAHLVYPTLLYRPEGLPARRGAAQADGIPELLLRLGDRRVVKGQLLS